MKLGSAFSDSLILEKKSVNRLEKMNPAAWWLGSGRTLFFASILIVTFFILAARLFELTMIQGHHFRALANENRVRELIRHAPRGVVVDRTGRPLVANTPSYRLVRPCGEAKTLCTERLSREAGDDLVKKGLPNGEFLEVDYRRDYLLGDALAHVLGYTGELTDNQLHDEYYTLRKYRSGDRIGQDGVEAVYEEKLRGRDGKELIEVNADGGVLRTLGVDPDAAGTIITLAIDAGLAQEVARDFPPGEQGAVVVSKPETGEILALYSSPSYNPNLFSAGLSQESFTMLFQNSQLPLFNRAIGGVYPPGSTYKIVTALSALSEGAIKADTTVEDVGVLTVGDTFKFPNWYYLQYGKTEGVLSLERALARSNDIFFYKTGEWLGITKLSAWSRRFGIGKPLGIELAGEASGLVPDPAWKNNRFTTQADQEAGNNLWYVGDTYHMAIGQGYLLVTPLQVNFWTGAVANGGRLCKPTIEKIAVPFREFKNCRDLGIDQKYITLVTEGMRDACRPGGTGYPLFNFKIAEEGDSSADDRLPQEATATAQKPSIAIPVACKTGTAEYGDPHGKTHAWFTVFAPLPESYVTEAKSQKVLTGEPEIAVTVLVEGAGEGSEKAAPVAKKILEYWFSR